MTYKIMPVVLLCSMLALRVFAQISQGENGIYYNEGNQPYTGVYIEFYSNGNKRVEMNSYNFV